MLLKLWDLFLSVLLAAVPPCRCSRENFLVDEQILGEEGRCKNAWSGGVWALVTSRGGHVRLSSGKMKKSLVQSPMEISGHQPPWMLVRLVILIQFPTFQTSIFFSVPVHIASYIPPTLSIKGYRCSVREQKFPDFLFCALRVSAIIFKVPLGQRK